MLAIGVMQAARARGLRVPEDLSVVGFDDTFEASIVTPALTTVRQPLAEMGRMAVSLLVRLLQNQRIEALHVELADASWSCGSSTAPVGVSAARLTASGCAWSFRALFRLPQADRCEDVVDDGGGHGNHAAEPRCR